ncbi:hypothetical protein TKK_0006116 [Trichogramma kaykai]
MVMALCCMPPPAVELLVDRPFVYKIMHKNQTLFSAVTIKARCMPPPAVELFVDKPFVYKVMYKNDTLFSGHVVDPLQN